MCQDFCQAAVLAHSPFFCYMYRLLFLLSFIHAVSVQAQQFGTEWLTSPLANDSSCQWFRRTFISKEANSRPVRASVCVATNSAFVLYVNGRNVSTSLFNASATATMSPTATTFDITRFLRPDTNTVALLAVPTPIHLEPPMLSIGYFGTTASGSCFARLSSDGWMCNKASTCIGPEGETIDGRLDALPPTYGDMAMPQWQPARILPPPTSGSVQDLGIAAECIYGYNPNGYNIIEDKAARIQKIIAPRYFDTDGKTISYDFSPGFYGLIRVTLRDCRRGERINIGNIEYICSGQTDEQATCRFSPTFRRKVTISGDEDFRLEQIQEVEAICF